MFEDYPKKRSALPKEFQVIYEQHYKSNREGETNAAGLAKIMEKWLHKQVAADVKNLHDKKTLEIGAGTLNHLEYEACDCYDIVEPNSYLYSGKTNFAKVREIYVDIDEIDLSQKYDRIISIATLEHIAELPKLIAKSCLHLNSSGVLRTGLPNEGTFLWTLGWKLTTGLEFRLKYGLDYGILMRHEHVNSADEIEDVLNYFYSVNTCKVFGINKRTAFYRFYESSKPKIEVAKDFLKIAPNI